MFSMASRTAPSPPSMACSTLMTGPLNHLRAEMSHQSITNVILGTIRKMFVVLEKGSGLRSSVYNDRPVHQLGRQIRAPHAREAQNRHHDDDEHASQHSNRLAEFPQMPRAATETITDKEGLDENGDRECDVRSDCTNGENGSDSHRASEDQEQETNAHGCVEPDGVDGRVRVLVHSLNPETHGKAAVTGICEGDSGRSNHTSLAHGETTDDGKAQNGQGDLLGHDLHEIRCPRLTKIRVDDGRDIDHGVGNNELQCPTHKTAEASCHDNGAGGGNAGICTLF